MDLDEHAESADRDREVFLFNDAPDGVWIRIDSAELVEADEIGTDEFPQYGTFLPVAVADGNDEIPSYLEIPRRVAKKLVDRLPADSREGEWFRLSNREKSQATGTWSAEIEIADQNPSLVGSAAGAMADFTCDCGERFDSEAALNGHRANCSAAESERAAAEGQGTDER